MRGEHAFHVKQTLSWRLTKGRTKNATTPLDGRLKAWNLAGRCPRQRKQRLRGHRCALPPVLDPLNNSRDYVFPVVVPIIIHERTSFHRWGHCVPRLLPQGHEVRYHLFAEDIDTYSTTTRLPWSEFSIHLRGGNEHGPHQRLPSSLITIRDTPSSVDSWALPYLLVRWLSQIDEVLYCAKASLISSLYMSYREQQQW